MFCRIGTGTYGLIVSIALIFCAALLICLPSLAEVGQKAAKTVVSGSSKYTLFINCNGNEKPKRVLSPVALSEGDEWSAYVEVNIQNDCLYTTRLWVAKGNRPYRLVYLIPPVRENAENGMEILGWARNSRMLLVQIEQWQYGSDAADLQRVLAIDAGTGVVYEPHLEALLQDRKDKRCAFRVTDAGFSSDKNVVMLVRAKFFTPLEIDETEADVPAAMRCGNTEETWSFNYATGEIKPVGSAEPLHIFRKFMPNQAK